MSNYPEPLTGQEREAYRQAMAAYPLCSCAHPLWAPISIKRGYCEACRLRGRTDTPAAAELVRVPARYLQRYPPPKYQTSEMRKYRHAYRSTDSRWHVERAYGACSGWRITDTTGEHTGCTCCAARDGGLDGHIATVPTLKAAKAFITEWSV